MTAKPTLEFWYEFASTYSYLAAMRIGALAEEAGVALLWRPFLLGPIFVQQGWNTSPFNLYPAKGRHMWRDMERETEALGLPLRRPAPFPQNSLFAARIALLGQENWGPAFTRALFRAEFGEGRSIAEPEVMRAALEEAGQDADAVFAQAQAEEAKAGLRAQNEAAVARGIFGAPSFVAADGELFWGNDRLERALAWAQSLAGRSSASIR
ncbi:2-hydroxychromene-2-carboxylate isomerase [Enterovirga sp.]|uniref:2-hydroxychromene-2-carboxylate isomerase n=1 Tax=Enterovirga sp. TaxID=2026350 RepID=UPI002C8E126D|nr:2-hydroxychromene-2-carboxylate isomerase [Enterovirga sp.]HMO27992.1 2-hydroxychromene-2-carboxylate isomerase [Enterovirga sp.]